VIVLDAPANPNLGDQPLDDSHLMLTRLLRRQHIIPPPTRTFAQLHAFAVGIGAIDASMSADELDQFFTVARHNDTLLGQAVLPRLDVPVTVFAARETADRHGLGADLGWSLLAASVRHAQILDGGHFDLLNTHAATVADAIGARAARISKEVAWTTASPTS
jgi:thioesterase domain-containing protein